MGRCLGDNFSFALRRYDDELDIIMSVCRTFPIGRAAGIQNK